MPTERPATPDDLELVANLLIAHDVEELGEPDWTVEDQAEEWRRPRVDLARDTRLVLDDDGRPVAYASVWARTEGADYDAEVFVLRSHAAELEPPLFAFAEERARETAGPGAVVHTVVHAPNTAAAGRLKAAGYEQVRAFWRMSIDLVPPLPDPVVPDGLVLRPFRPGDEHAVHTALHESFRDHFRFADETYEQWSERVLSRADFDPGVVWLVTDGGEPAAAAIGVDNGEGTGWIRTLGVRRPWRGRGLGRALLYAAFGTFAERGFARVALGVDAENPTGATRLYESAGMKVVRQFDFYRKSLDA